jgi:hypothetical protein
VADLPESTTTSEQRVDATKERLGITTHTAFSNNMVEEGIRDRAPSSSEISLPAEPPKHAKSHA